MSERLRVPLPEIPAAWRQALAEATAAASYAALSRFVDAERAAGPVYPAAEHTFAALAETPLEAVSVVLLGQDPYHREGQAHGLCFSVPRGVRTPPSLRNLLKELEQDVGVRSPPHGDLTAWAHAGVLLLNTVLTVPEGTPGGHAKKGWEAFTDAVLAAVAARDTPTVFLLLGGHARKKKDALVEARHRVIEAAHPSPLSARAFLGSKPFSRVAAALRELGRSPVDFSRPA